MIKNIIFDMGGVLIDYDPERVAAELFDGETAEIVLKKLLRSDIWAMKDRGTITPDEIIERIKDDIPPEALPKVTELANNLYPYMPPFEDTYELVRDLKSGGYGVYLLSNASMDFYERKSGIPALALFDGYIISAEYHLLKPEKEIYLTLFDKFGLKPEECFFIDDVQANIDGAAAVGMRGFRYSKGHIAQLRAALGEAGVKI